MVREGRTLIHPNLALKGTAKGLRHQYRRADELAPGVVSAVGCLPTGLGNGSRSHRRVLPGCAHLELVRGGGVIPQGIESYG